jgi:TPR repeat protein
MNSRIIPVLFIVFLSGPAAAGFNEGVAAYEANNLPLAYREFRASAEEGDAPSQFNLGLMYEQGIGVAKDEKAAVIWYRNAAEQGVSSAQYNLAVLYENGRGSPVDFEQANRWYREAAAQGDPLAIGNLGMLYIRGDGVPVNQVAGLALLLVSATLDSSPANHARANIMTVKGLRPDTIAEAQALSSEMTDAKQLLVPFDRYLGRSQKAK